jgi:hypothetical protein
MVNKVCGQRCNYVLKGFMSSRVVDNRPISVKEVRKTARVGSKMQQWKIEGWMNVKSGGTVQPGGPLKQHGEFVPGDLQISLRRGIRTKLRDSE